MAQDSSGWTARARAWAEHWPRLSEPARLAVADAVGLGPGVRVLDAGCGTGEFCALALARGAQVSGIDVAEGMLALARERAPEADLRVGDIGHLPWADDAFDVVTAFNAVQFTDDVLATIAELARVATRVVICNWREGAHLTALFGALTEDDSAGDEEAETRKAVGRPGVLEALMRDAGLVPEVAADVETPYETRDLAMLISALRDGSGFEASDDAIRDAAAAFAQPGGGYRLENRFRYVVATRAN
jgi:SAM-dependent methyltransferase